MEPQPYDISRVENAILHDPSVYDCAVRLRQSEHGATRLVAYVVAGIGFTEHRLRERLQHTSPIQPDVFVPLSALPISAEGLIDEQALAALPVLDSELLRRYEGQLLSTGAVAEAAVLTEEYTPESLPFHISDLLPPNVGAASIAWRDNIAIPEAQPTSSNSQADLRVSAISCGGALRNLEIPAVMGDALKRAAAMPETHGITYVQQNGTEVYQSYSDLLEDAQRILAGLRDIGLKPQDPVILQLDRNQDFIPAFWACMLGGFLAAPISIAPTYKEPNSAISKLHNCWELLNRPLVIAGDKLSPEIRSISAVLGLQDFRVASIDRLRSNQQDYNWHAAKPDDVCLILFTSGSTGLPKGVQQCHRTLLSRSAATAERNQFDCNEVSLNWFPLDHVGGIVMFHLMDLFTCAHQVQVQTEVILQDPLKWLDYIDRLRATITWAPNFAFGLVNDREAEIKVRKWDLSSMQFILNGGEAIVAKTTRRFLQMLAPHGLRPDAMHPSWGMSETCSGVVFSERCRCDIIRDEDSFVEVGGPIAGVSLRVVDGKDRVVEEGRVGRLQISGATVTPGYYRNPDLNRESFSADGWFNTGDLALLREGRLTITGRSKDVIIINGVNFYSHELEAIVESVDGVDVSFAAACPVRIACSDTDRLAVFFSTSVAGWAPVLDVITRIRETLLRTAGVRADYVIPLPQAEIPKTAIGKIQRSKLRERFEAGEFSELLKQIDIRSGSADTVPDWFYRKVWRRREPSTYRHLDKGRYLVFADAQGLAERICAELDRAGAHCVRVIQGKRFDRPRPDNYVVVVDSLADYDRMIASVGRVDYVVHCWAYDTSASDIDDIECLRTAQQRGVYSILLLIKAIAKNHNPDGRVRFFGITNAGQSISPDDRLRPEHSPIIGLLESAAMEAPWLQCRHVDVEGECVTDDASHVVRELAVDNSRAQVAYRGGSRRVLSVAKVDLLREPAAPAPIKKGGLYLLTGGLGGLGTLLAEHLMCQYEAHLLLIGRTQLPEHGPLGADARLGKLLRNYELLTRCGGEFLYRAIELSETEALRSCVAEAETHWGRPLDGVFHLAGSLAASADLKAHFDSIEEHSVSNEAIEAFETIFQAKLYGTWSVLQMLHERSDALFVAFSSVNGAFGGATLSAYSAANSALDALVLQHHRHHPNTYCFNWTMWDDVGMSEGGSAYARETARSMGYQLIGKLQGINSMLAGLCRREPQLIVGLAGTGANLRRYVDLEVYPLIRPVAYYVGATSDAPPISPDQQRAALRLIPVPHLPRNESGEIDRAQLATLHVRTSGKPVAVAEARTEMERHVARIWKDVLGVSRIGMTDTFFHLGGDSLTAIRVVNRLRETLDVSLSVRAVFEKPTIAELCAMLVEIANMPRWSATAGAPPLTADTLAHIDQMSDEEVGVLLDEITHDKVLE